MCGYVPAMDYGKDISTRPRRSVGKPTPPQGRKGIRQESRLRSHTIPPRARGHGTIILGSFPSVILYSLMILF